MSILNKSIFNQLKDFKLDFCFAKSGVFYFHSNINGKIVKSAVSEYQINHIVFDISESIDNLSKFYFCQIFVDDEMIFSNH
jgi:hypothetical protein